jgi:DNA primase
MTFYQAVRHVAQEFGDPNLQLDFASSSANSRLSDEDRKALSEKKQRLLLANAAAAAFYGKCLITMPAAGVARFHVQARGLSPTTVHAFAMGYAPDAYFRVKGEWGKGSLVHYLRDLGFKPSEIIKAGLATRTRAFEQKGANKGSVVATNSGSNATISQIEENDDDYDTLIDRFRNRLVVPIFDGKGANVLGFGGRILPPEENDNSGFESPKYINSPESPVFHKKDVIFSQYSASKVVAEMRNPEANGESGPGRGSVVIVEGYMDAIALWEAGVREVVASMGTALTMEQLTNAAKTAGTRGGTFENEKE